MKKMKRLMAGLAAAFILLHLGVFAHGTAQWRGYEPKIGYQYVQFGTYPTAKDGAAAPVLWRILGVEDGVACLMSEYIIDFITFNDVKDPRDNPLRYQDAVIFGTINQSIVMELFTDQERACLLPLAEDRGLLSIPSYLELRNPDYGFKNHNFTIDKNRQAFGTPYAHSLGLRKIMRTGQTWYWTTEWRRAGYRWIVGEDGHISVSGIDRKGGFRPVCNVQIDLFSISEGDGSFDSPFHATAAESQP